jgi:uncharacterized membrane protein
MSNINLPTLTPWQWGAIAAIFILGAFLRIHNIDRPMQYDETYTYEVYVRPGITHTLARYDFPNNHIFHSLLVYGSTLVSQSEAAIRAPALLFALASIILLFFLTKRFFSIGTAYFATFLFALARYQIEYGHNARGYSMNVFFVMLSAYGLFSIIEDPLTKTSRNWAIYATGAVLSIYTLPTTLFYIVPASAFALIFFFYKRRQYRGGLRECLKYQIIVAAASFFLYIPALVFFYLFPGKIWLFGGDPSPKISIFLPQILSYLFSPFIGAPALACVSIVAVTGAVLLWRKDKMKGIIISCIILFPFALIAATRMPIFDRNLLYLQPFLFICLAYAISALQGFLKKWRLDKAFVFAAVMAIILCSFKTTYADFTIKNDLSPKQAAAVVNSVVKPGDMLFLNFIIDNKMRYYLNNLNKELYLSMFQLKRSGTINEQLTKARDIYVVFSGSADFEAITRIYGLDQELLRQNYQPFTLFRQIGDVMIFHTKPAQKHSNG